MKADRFWTLVDKTETCWVWTGTKDRLGYGRIQMRLHGVRVQLAHRAAFILTRGYHPPALDHLCRNPSCVNPSHLDPCGQAENGRRQQWPPHCPHGHEFTPENTRHYTSRKGYRVRLCAICNRENQARYYHSEKGRAAKRRAWLRRKAMRAAKQAAQ